MGEREATVEQLDAMQEPLRRERAQQQEQEDYFARVRAKAEERAREILGAAYAERQRVLDEARAEAQAFKQSLIGETEALKARAQEEKDQASAELLKAQDLQTQAQAEFDAAHGEGFQAGMDQAGQELKEFRAEMGQALGNVLHALDAQRRGICDAWREELALLTQEAVTAGTGWVLEEEHKRILQSLVFEALNLLEDRASITVRVHPDDEDTVSDMFMAARERVPELQQWVVNGDASIERGGLVAESVSGSVDCRREHYAELVNGILSHLTLGPDQKEDDDGEAVSRMVRQEAERIAAMTPAPEHPAASGHEENDPAHATSPGVAEQAAPESPYEAAASHAGDPLAAGLPSDRPGDVSGNMADDHWDAGSERSLPAADEQALEAGHQATVPDSRAMLAEDDAQEPVADAPESADRLNAEDGAAPESAGMPGTEGAAAAVAPEQGGSAHAPERDDFAPPLMEGAAAGEHGRPHMPGSTPDSMSNSVPDSIPDSAHASTPSPASEDAPPAPAGPDAAVQTEPQTPASNTFSEEASGAGAPQTVSAPSGASAGQESSGEAQAVHRQDARPAAVAPQAGQPAAAQPVARAANPTLAELEDELFPLDEGLGAGMPVQDELSLPSGHSTQSDQPEQSTQSGSGVFSQGGFLPGAGKGR